MRGGAKGLKDMSAKNVSLFLDGFPKLIYPTFILGCWSYKVNYLKLQFKEEIFSFGKEQHYQIKFLK